eukprot:TRINITY_DN48519_c0_g1_i1.p1 TRINITY_DN48519_c0_g1~~TRINITY_DN48519_c0_g1_i1.p1  ORF type:complete len:612 (+),score=119.06 TRINITY_DN48519_c0_g1_i1:193-1836(+)
MQFTSQDPAYVNPDRRSSVPLMGEMPGSLTTGVGNMGQTNMLLDSVAQKCSAWASAKPGSSMVMPVLEKEATLTAISNLALSVSLADPNLPDCPLIGVSDGFAELTGYSKHEVIGKNCRFLNKGLTISADVKQRMRDAVLKGCEFVGKVQNIRKCGTLFENFLHMTTLWVRGTRYIIGIQLDATHVQVDLDSGRQQKVIEAIASQIFTTNLNAWVQMQARDFYMRLPVPCSEILQLSFPDQFKAEQDQFVRLAGASTAESCPDTYDSTIQDEPEPQPDWVQTVRSAGSAGHPDNCKECTFYFFSTQGCRSGADCSFCHEFHPRKNGKKNRRIIRTLRNRQDGVGSPEEDIKEAASLEVRCHVEMPATNDIKKPPAPGAVPVKEQTGADMPILKEKQATKPVASTGDGMIRLSYRQASLMTYSSAPESLTLICGMPACLSPSLTYASEEGRRCLEPTLSFVVQPPLPAGLSLNAKTGAISGVPADASPKAGVHIVTVKVPAQGCGGIALGDVPLFSCKLVLSVLSPANFTVIGTDPVTGAPLLSSCIA